MGRDLTKMIILDNSPASYIFHPDNAVPCTSWFDDMQDTELIELIPHFERLATVDNIYSILKTSPQSSSNGIVVGPKFPSNNLPNSIYIHHQQQQQQQYDENQQVPSHQSLIYQVQQPTMSVAPLSNVTNNYSPVMVDPKSMQLIMNATQQQQQQQQTVNDSNSSYSYNMKMNNYSSNFDTNLTALKQQQQQKQQPQPPPPPQLRSKN